MALPLPWRSRTFKSKINYYISNNRRVRIAGISSAFMLTLLAIATLAPLANKTQYTEAATGTAQSSTITISDLVSASMNLAVDSNAGTFTTTDTGPSGASTTTAGTRGSFNVTTNNVSGYYLTISASDDTGALVNADDANTSTNSIASITSNMTASTFNSSAYNGKWGYKPSKYMTSTDASSVVDNTSTSTGVYLPAPTTTVTMLDKTTTANSSTANSYTIDLAARLQYTQTSGTYTKTFILTATGNPVTYSITYSDNTGDSTVANLPARQYNDEGTSSTSITLTSSTPTRTGYTFSKWCLGTVSNNGTTCTGTQYSAGGSFGIDQTTENTTTLYAVWTPNVYTLTLTNTNATTTGSTAARVTYNSSTVYGGTSGTSGITNPSRSYNFTTFSNAYNNASDAIVSSTANKTYTYGFDGWYTASSGGTRIITSAGALAASTSYTNSSSAWTSTSSPTLYAHWNYGSVTLPTITKEGYDCGWGTSTNTTTKTYQSGATVTSTNAPATDTALYGVCSVNSYDITLNGDANVSDFTVNNSTVSKGSSISLVYGQTYSITINYASGYKANTFVLQSGAGSLSGTSFTVGAGTATLYATSQVAATYIQDYTLATCQSEASSANKTVVDKRDNKEYTVRYINGACWMTSNLRYLGDTGSTSTSMIVKSATTNYNSNTTLTLKDLTNGSSTSSDCYGAYSSSTYTGNGWTNLCVHEGIDNNGDPTVWYNYSAATVGTIATKGANSTAATYDVCPKNWRLPTNSEQSGITSYTTAFSPVYGGYYRNGSLSNAATYGYWWSATAYDARSRYLLYYNSGSLNTSSSRRYYGSYVRCIRTTSS